MVLLLMCLPNPAGSFPAQASSAQACVPVSLPSIRSRAPRLNKSIDQSLSHNTGSIRYRMWKVVGEPIYPVRQRLQHLHVFRTLES